MKTNSSEAHNSKETIVTMWGRWLVQPLPGSQAASAQPFQVHHVRPVSVEQLLLPSNHSSPRATAHVATLVSTHCDSHPRSNAHTRLSLQPRTLAGECKLRQDVFRWVLSRWCCLHSCCCQRDTPTPGARAGYTHHLRSKYNILLFEVLQLLLKRVQVEVILDGGG